MFFALYIFCVKPHSSGTNCRLSFASGNEYTTPKIARLKLCGMHSLLILAADSRFLKIFRLPSKADKHYTLIAASLPPCSMSQKRATVNLHFLKLHMEFMNSLLKCSSTKFVLACHHAEPCMLTYKREP